MQAQLREESHGVYESQLPETKEGIETTINVHKNASKQKTPRTGWHSKRACFGCTKSLSTKVKKPTDIYLAMKEFVQEEKPLKPQEERQITNRLAALGYIDG